MSPTVVRPEVVQFVRDVRAALNDLSPEEVDELTDGLEADLSDAVDAGAIEADGVHAVAARFGDPGAYAAELRSAAGLPPRSAPTRPGLGASLSQLRANASGLLDPLRRQPWWAPFSAYVVSLRPAWWLVRGWIAYQMFSVFIGSYGLLPDSFGGWVVLLLFVGVSVEIGRRALQHRADGWRILVGIGNVVAVLALLPTLAYVTQPAYYETSGAAVAVPPDQGLWHGGREVRNVFPYDEQGRPLTGVQLYDENGNRLAVGPAAEEAVDDTNGFGYHVPAVNAEGQQLWNVFPLRRQAAEWDPETGEPRPVGSAQPAPLPVVAVPPLLLPRSDASPAPGASPTPTPSPSATSTPSKDGSSEASPKPSPIPSSPGSP